MWVEWPCSVSFGGLANKCRDCDLHLDRERWQDVQRRYQTNL